ncbi:MAG: hypothetical protein JWR78_661 [Mycobacterium sp.]|nr:hypothetical protein [Mycobacterium sp.]
MFDSLVADTAGARGAGAVGAWARVEAAACARRLAAMLATLDGAYAADGSANRDQWCLDNWGARLREELVSFLLPKPTPIGASPCRPCEAPQ